MKDEQVPYAFGQDLLMEILKKERDETDSERLKKIRAATVCAIESRNRWIVNALECCHDLCPECGWILKDCGCNPGDVP